MKSTDSSGLTETLIEAGRNKQRSITRRDPFGVSLAPRHPEGWTPNEPQFTGSVPCVWGAQAPRLQFAAPSRRTFGAGAPRAFVPAARAPSAAPLPAPAARQAGGAGALPIPHCRLGPRRGALRESQTPGRGAALAGPVRHSPFAVRPAPIRGSYYSPLRIAQLLRCRWSPLSWWAPTCALALLLGPAMFAQVEPSAPPDTELAATEPTIVARDYNSCAWQWTVPKVWPDGQIIPDIHGYIELNVGGWYQDVTGQWLPTEEWFELLADGAAALHGPHSLLLSGNLNTRGAIDLFAPEGKRFTINVIGLAYVDSASGQTVVLSVIKDPAWLIDSSGPNG